MFGQNDEEYMMKRILILIIMAIILSACNSVSTPVPQVTDSPAPTATALVVPTQTTSLTAATVETGSIQIACTNSLSDAATINTAIATSAMGDEIVISGQCLINETIKLLGDRSYRGTSRTGTILKQADGANLVALLASDTFLENLEWTGTPLSLRQMTLDGNSKMNQEAQTDGLVIRSWFSVVEDMYITDMSRDGIKVASKTANGENALQGQVNGRISASMINMSGRYAVYAEEGVTDWNVFENWIAFSGVDGLHLEDVAGWVIERNHIYGVPQNAIHAEHLFGTSISDNLIEGFGETDQVGEWYGIYATVQGGAASTISDNRIFNIGLNLEGPNNPASIYRYISLTVNYNIGVVSLTGNTLRGMGTGNEFGLDFTASGNQLNVISANNAVIDIETPQRMGTGVTLSPGY
jgi:hypothetical protein